MSKRTVALKIIRATAINIAHEKLKETLPDHEQEKLKGDEVIKTMYIRNSRGYLELSPLCYKYHYIQLKKAYETY